MIHAWWVAWARSIGATDTKLAADGQWFLVKVPVKGGNEASIHVVANWPSLLE